jgi:hypothetical protein
MATAVGDTRFIPYIQRHEFESLVLACLEQLEASDPCEARWASRSCEQHRWVGP